MQRILSVSFARICVALLGGSADVVSNISVPRKASAI
jgi:hypothetical protein